MNLYMADFGWGRPGGAALRAAGFYAVARYISHDRSKCLTADEVQDYRKAGLHIVPVFEDSATRPLQGSLAGQADGMFTADVLRSLDFTPGAWGPVFYAVDFDVQPDTIGTVSEYGRGFRLGLLTRFSYTPECGVYGPTVVLNTRPVTVGYGWQTSAWSRKVKATAYSFYQTGRQTTVNGVTVDVNIVNADYLEGTGNSPMGVADDSIKGMDNQFPGLNPSDFQRAVPALYQKVEGLHIKVDTLAAKVGTVPDLDYDELAELVAAKLLASVLTSAGKTA